MNDAYYHNTLVTAFELSSREKRVLVGHMRPRAWHVHIFPGPAPTPLSIYPRIWYEWTGRRQWLVAPGLRDTVAGLLSRERQP